MAANRKSEFEIPVIQADCAQGRRGRKQASKSRAAEFRAKLLAWKQIPESARPSLRALASELGTSHQLLSVYCKGLTDWQKKDYQRRAEAIRNAAETENRGMNPREESQVRSLERAALYCKIDSLWASTLKRYAAELRGKKSFTRDELKIVKILAHHGVPMARKLLEKQQINLPSRSSEGS